MDKVLVEINSIFIVEYMTVYYMSQNISDTFPVWKGPEYNSVSACTYHALI